MIIDLASVGTAPKSLHLNVRANEIDLDEDGKLVGDAEFNGEIFENGGRVYVRGKINASVFVECSRCLEPSERQLDIPFEDIFLDAGLAARKEELEIGVADMDESLVIGGEIDMRDVVREQVILALPAMSFCRDDCRGLCPKCGQNRNLIDCNCEEIEIDPRWAALKNLN